MKALGRISTAVAKFVRNWPAHLLTLALIGAVLAIAPRQSTLILFKTALLPLGACVGYWLDVFFFGRRNPRRGDKHRKWQLVALMCAGVIGMAIAA